MEFILYLLTFIGVLILFIVAIGGIIGVLVSVKALAEIIKATFFNNEL